MMVIGSGMLATAFNEYMNNNSIVIFASGVSNSKEDNPEAYEREENLLNSVIDENSDKTIVYFSTCSIYDGSVNLSTYVQHKISMEKIIDKKCSHFFIFRLPQVVGLTNSPTLVNFLFTAIESNKLMKINKYSTRNIIYVGDVIEIVNYLIDNKVYVNEITNIATPYNTKVLDIVLEIEKIVGVKANYQLIDLGERQNINITKIRSLNIDWNIFHINYIHNTLKKYFMEICGK